jgi:hypothetical protein
MSAFEDHPSLCELPLQQIISFLEEIEDMDAAQSLRNRGASGQSLFGGTRKYLIGSHMFGFIAPNADSHPLPIEPATTISADESLIGTTIKITLDKFRVANYPGSGQHRILTELFGRNQAGRETEDLRFSTMLSAKDNDSAGASGVPIFTGLKVPADGLALEARTVCVGSSTDDAIIAALESGPFKEGLKLLSHVQPVLPQLVTLASGATTAILKRRKNAQVQKFVVGLDFSKSATSAKLRIGSYVVVQAPDDGSFNWSDWRFDPRSSSIVSEQHEVAPFNTIVFGVSASEGDAPSSAERAT